MDYGGEEEGRIAETAARDKEGEVLRGDSYPKCQGKGVLFSSVLFRFSSYP